MFTRLLEGVDFEPVVEDPLVVVAPQYPPLIRTELPPFKARIALQLSLMNPAAALLARSAP